MTTNRPIRVGTGGSPLSLVKDEEVLSKLGAHHPNLRFEMVIVRTGADAGRTSPPMGMDLDVFICQIEERLLSGELDMAIHNLKDLPAKLPDGLVLGAILERRDPRDVLVNRWNCRMSELPEGARIGTGSLRCAATLRVSRWCPFTATWKLASEGPRAARPTARCLPPPDWRA